MYAKYLVSIYVVIVFMLALNVVPKVYSEYIFSPMTITMLCASFYLIALSHFLNKPFELMNRTKIIARSVIFSALLNLILNFIFVPIYGPVGASISMFLACLGITVYLVKRSSRAEIEA